MERRAKIDAITKLIYQYCVEPDKERIKRTGTITPTNSLRHQSTRHALRFAKSIGTGERFFTKALTRDCLKHLLTHYTVELPCTPGCTTEEWIKQQGEMLHKLLKRARKSTAAMEEETQAWDVMAGMELDPTEDLPLPVNLCDRIDI